MESSRVTCTHCDFLFYPEEGVAVDDCPVCGRTVEVKPAPAPQPEDVEPLRAALDKLRCGYKRLASSYNYLARWTADEATKSEHQIDDLTRRLAEAELEACESMAGAHAEQEVSRHWKQEAEYQNARVRELEATITLMTNAHAHDDQALTAAYLSGAHAGKKQAEAFKARVMAWARGRCECCEHKNVRREDTPCEQCLHTSNYDNWAPPSGWEDIA